MTKRFGTGARIFHWLVLLLLLVQIPAGIAMIAPALEQGSIDRLFVLHKGLGTVLLVIVLARALWRLTHAAPPMAATIPEQERRIATAAHATIYVVLIVVAGSGYVRVVGEGFPIEMMDALGLPTLLPLMPEVALWASLVHRFSIFLLVAMVAVHIAEVLRHQLVLRDGTLGRMWPPFGGGNVVIVPNGNGLATSDGDAAATPDGDADAVSDVDAQVTTDASTDETSGGDPSPISEGSPGEGPVR